MFPSSLQPDQKTIRVEPDDGPNALSVHPVSESHPDCGVKPTAEERTIIVVSEAYARP